MFYTNYVASSKKLCAMVYGCDLWEILNEKEINKLSPTISQFITSTCYFFTRRSRLLEQWTFWWQCKLMRSTVLRWQFDVAFQQPTHLGERPCRSSCPRSFSLLLRFQCLFALLTKQCVIWMVKNWLSTAQLSDKHAHVGLPFLNVGNVRNCILPPQFPNDRNLYRLHYCLLVVFSHIRKACLSRSVLQWTTANILSYECRTHIYHELNKPLRIQRLDPS